jgi:hypothetical protein
MPSKLSNGVVAVKYDVEILNLLKTRFECIDADFMNFTTEFLDEVLANYSVYVSDYRLSA